MIILEEDNLSPNKWLLARVVNVHPGADDKVRVVTIKTKDGTYRRQIMKLCPLPIAETYNVDNESYQGGENI